MQVVEGASDALLTKMALVILGQARVNIRENDQIDTGFMTNSGYVVAPGEDGYDKTWPSGQYQSGKTGQTAMAERAPKQTPPEGASLVGFAADYAIYQEMARSYLYKALDQSKGQFDATVKTVGREHFG